MIRFIHAADLHLGQPMHNIRRLDSEIAQALIDATVKSFNNIIDTAVNEQVDFVLFSGDIYDSPVGTLKEQFIFKSGLEKLNDAGISAFVLFGNHDFKSLSAHHIDLPENTIVFGNEVTTYHYTSPKGERVAISGFSYDTRWIMEDRTVDYPNRNANSEYWIGMLHGALKTGNSQLDHYAPFSLEELTQFQYDYWALGHIHNAPCLSETPPVYYSGNIQGRSSKETGPKGGRLVTLSTGNNPKVEFFETTDWQFHTREAFLGNIESVEALKAAVEFEYRQENVTAINEGLHYLSTIHFEVEENNQEALYWWHHYHDSLLEQIQLDRETEDVAQHAAFLIQLSLSVRKQEQTAYSSLFLQQINELFDRYQEKDYFKEALTPLTNNKTWQRYLQTNIDVDSFQDDVLRAAKEKLWYYLNQQ